MAGAVKSGDRDMLSGGAAEGGNQENTIVLVLKEYLSDDRKHTVLREPSLEYFVIQDGSMSKDASHRNITHDMVVKDYDGKSMFHKASRVSFFGINTNPVSIIVPVSVRLSDGTPVDGTILLDVACDPRSPERSITLLNGDYNQRVNRGMEKHTFLNADSLSKLIRNTVGDCSLNVLSGFGKTFDISNQIRSRLYDELNMDVKMSSMGLVIIRASLRFSEASSETILRMRSEGKVQMAEDEIEYEKRILKINLAKKEYRAINGEDE